MTAGSVLARLGPALRDRYALIHEIGAGAMATVYLARDVRHERRVAIKVLKPDLAAVLGADRFLAEITTTANLQHPHIVPLFDSGEADGFLFYVMPYITGESLRSRLDRERQLPLDETVAITRAVAAALDYAHRNGIVHRDIKPANILLQDGQPVVSDFGIALAVRNAGGTRLTETGISVGTPSYMSPEQAAGERGVDGRSDLYSLGCVAYEMLAGEPPFTAPTTRALVMRILTEAPAPLTMLRPAVPAHVAGAVTKALEKVPADRFDTGSAFARALADETFRWPPAPASAREAANRRRFAASAVVATVATAVAVWALTRPVGSPATAPVVRLAFTLPNDQVLPVGPSRSVIEISPGGAHLVYVGANGTESQLYVRKLGDFEVRALAGTRDAREPFFSPDGNWIGFFANGKLKKIRVDAGVPIEIADAPGTSYGGSWGDDGTILFSLNDTTLWRVAAEGGTPEALRLTIAAREGQASPAVARSVPAPVRWPRHLPGGKSALVTVGWTDERGRPNQAGLTGVVDLHAGTFRPLFGGSRAYYVPTGHIVFDAGLEEVRAVPFNLDRLAVTGPPAPLVNNALRRAGSGTTFGVSQSGVLAYAAGGFERRLVIVDRYGRETPLAISAQGYRFPSISPDGRYIAVTVDPQPPQIWIVDLRRARTTPLTTDGYSLYASWSRDGTRLVFNRLEVDTPGVYEARWPEGGEPRLIRANRDPVLAPRWAKGEQLFLVSNWDLLLLDLETDSTTDLATSRAREREPSLSPDGNWVAFTSDATGIDEVYVLPYSGKSAPIPVSNGGGAEPRWSADGRELFFRSGNTILGVKVRTRPTFELAAPVEQLFSAAYDFSNGSNWDVLPDGRFVMVKSSPNVGREIRFVLNWSGLLGADSKSVEP